MRTLSVSLIKILYLRIIIILSVSTMMVGCSREQSSGERAKVLYPNNSVPLLETEFVKLPLGTVKPMGWLRGQLIVQVNGYTGHLPELWDVMKNTAWKGDTNLWSNKRTYNFGEVSRTTTYTGTTGLNMYPECCYPRFVPRWLEGLIPIAYLLDDDKLKVMVDQYMSYILTVEKPENVTPSITAWSHLGRVLPAYYDVTKNKKVIELCGRMLDYFDRIKGNNLSPQPEAVQQTRLGMPLSFMWWYYNQTGDTTVFSKMSWISKNCVDYYRDFFTSTRTPTQHIVDVCQAVQYPIQYYLMSKDKSYVECVYSGMKKLDALHGQVAGRWNGDEYTSGLSPTQGSELCSVTELIYSLVKNFEALGDPVFADRLESLVFNAVPGACTGDWWAHQYDQQANQVLVSVDKRKWVGNNNTSNIFGFTPNYPCCLSNMHSPFPNYIQYMWMATKDRGLVASVYGPSQVKAMVADGKEITVTEETNYPFSDVVKFTITGADEVSFPIHFRIPSWAGSSEIAINDREIKHPEKGTIFKVDRKWKTGDVVTLSLHAKVRTETRLNNSIAVAWGPLYFSLRIGESFKKIDISEDRRVKTDYPTAVVNWQIDPTTAWNYGLAIDRANPEYEMVTNKISKFPFARKDEPVWLQGASEYTLWPEDVPLVLKMKAKLVPQWVMEGASAGIVPLSPVKVATEETIVELVPYGCTRLRISEFPVIDTSKK